LPLSARRRSAKAAIGSLTTINLWARGLGQRSREYVVPLAGIGVGHPMTDCKVVGLPSNNGGANRAIKGAHAVVPFGARTLEPIDRTVLARDETIGTRCEVNDEFRFAWHAQTCVDHPSLHLMKNEACHATSPIRSRNRRIVRPEITKATGLRCWYITLPCCTLPAISNPVPGAPLCVVPVSSFLFCSRL
jgi:hypothetical protein